MSNNFQCRCPFCQPGTDKKITNFNGNELHICHHCSEIFECTSHLVDHIESHEKKRFYSCDWPDCGKMFSKKSYLGKHKPVHSREKKYECDICGYRSSTKSDLTEHIRYHRYGTKKPRKKIVPCDCPNCQAIKAGGPVIRDSIRRRLHNCRYCNRALNYPSDLRRHMNTHFNKRPFTLKTHMQPNAEEKDHICLVCKRSFQKAKSLKSHLKVHVERCSEKKLPKVVETVGLAKEPHNSSSIDAQLDMILEESLQLQAEILEFDFVFEQQKQQKQRQYLVQNQNQLQAIEYDPVHSDQWWPVKVEVSNFQEVDEKKLVQYVKNMSDSEWQEVIEQWL